MTAAKYAGICKDCKKEYAIGVEIHRNTRQNWCRDGDKCSLVDRNEPKKPEQIQHEQMQNQQQQLDSRVNDQTAEMTAKAIQKVLLACWKLSYEDACNILKSVDSSNGHRDTLILAEVFFKEYSAHYRELLKK
jgi:hypothetical protein